MLMLSVMNRGQVIKVMERRYQSRWDAHIMADHCWSIMLSSGGIDDLSKHFN